jgi:hypothetical protein
MVEVRPFVFSLTSRIVQEPPLKESYRKRLWSTAAQVTSKLVDDVYVLSQIRLQLPQARILFINYYNPDGSLSATKPLNIANAIFD